MSAIGHKGCLGQQGLCGTIVKLDEARISCWNELCTLFVFEGTPVARTQEIDCVFGCPLPITVYVSIPPIFLLDLMRASTSGSRSEIHWLETTVATSCRPPQVIAMCAARKQQTPNQSERQYHIPFWFGKPTCKRGVWETTSFGRLLCG